jgi:histidinol-phosphate aminotransferase
LPLRPKRNITGLRKCHHGGIVPSEMESLGMEPGDILDFSVSTNPFMPPPGIREIAGTIAFTEYPDSEATELRRILSGQMGIPEENILVGSGTTELIRLIATTYFRQGDKALILEPTYGEYETACRIAGARMIRYYSGEYNNFTPPIDEITDLIQKRHPRAVFICNPNNPTGHYFSQNDIEAVLDVMADGLTIIDEAYIAFVEGSWDSTGLINRDNVVILRSMTKDYGMPGLRLGYAMAHSEIIHNLRLVLPPWNVNAIAQKVGVAVLAQQEYLRQSLQQVKEAKRFLVDSLTGMGFEVLPSDANYFLVRVGSAGRFRSSLLKHRIQVRDCTSFGLPEYIRLSPRTLPECVKLITAIEDIIKSGKDGITL